MSSSLSQFPEIWGSWVQGKPKYNQEGHLGCWSDDCTECIKRYSDWKYKTVWLKICMTSALDKLKRLKEGFTSLWTLFHLAMQSFLWKVIFYPETREDIHPFNNGTRETDNPYDNINWEGTSSVTWSWQDCTMETSLLVSCPLPTLTTTSKIILPGAQNASHTFPLVSFCGPTAPPNPLPHWFQPDGPRTLPWCHHDRNTQ